MAETEINLGGANARQVILVVGGALFAALCLFALWYLVIRTHYLPAFTDLKSADASVIIGELKRQKTPYELADNGTTIMVPEEQVDASRVNILGGDLPLKGTVGFELFNQSDMGLTEFAQKINYQRALQGELSRTLMALDNVETARVHLSLPDSGVFERDKRIAKASVTITPKLGKTVDGPAVSGIQRLIASAVPDLETNNVAVLGVQGQLLSEELLQATDAEREPQGTAIEQEYVSLIRNAIFPLIPDPNVRVSVKIAQDMIKSVDESSMPLTDDAKFPKLAVKEAGRKFPIRISIVLPTTPDVQMRAKLVPLLTESVGYDPIRGDSLMILASPVLPPQTTSRNIEPAGKNQSAPTVQNNPINSTWIWIFLGLFLTPLFYISVRKIMQQRKMSLTQRVAFTDRLRVLIDEQGSGSSESF